MRQRLATTLGVTSIILTAATLALMASSAAIDSTLTTVTAYLAAGTAVMYLFAKLATSVKPPPPKVDIPRVTLDGKGNPLLGISIDDVSKEHALLTSLGGRESRVSLRGFDVYGQEIPEAAYDANLADVESWENGEVAVQLVAEGGQEPLAESVTRVQAALHLWSKHDSGSGVATYMPIVVVRDLPAPRAGLSFAASPLSWRQNDQTMSVHLDAFMMTSADWLHDADSGVFDARVLVVSAGTASPVIKEAPLELAGVQGRGHKSVMATASIDLTDFGGAGAKVDLRVLVSGHRVNGLGKVTERWVLAASANGVTIPSSQ